MTMIRERMSLMEIVDSLEKKQLVLPLFQRPFVWSEEQVCDLFDSLLQDYPIGHILLLEQIPADLKQRLHCCEFYSQAGNQYIEENLLQRRREARIFENFQEASHVVLDGQQRLFAFYIGIAGAYLRSVTPGFYENAKLYFDLCPLIRTFFESGENLENLRLEHHQFCFYSDDQLARYRAEIQEEFGQSWFFEPLLPLALVQSWGRDRRTARSEIRRFLKPGTGLPKPLCDELEDILDNLHHRLWVSRLVHNITVQPRNSYDLLEIFSRLNQGSSFQASDLHYAVRIISPEQIATYGQTIKKLSRHLGKNFGKSPDDIPSQNVFDSSGVPNKLNNMDSEQQQSVTNNKSSTTDSPKPFLGGQHYSSEELAEFSAQDWNSEIFHELNPEDANNTDLNMGSITHDELEENYESLLQAADELKMSLDFLYHCYLFCEAGAPETIAQSIRKKEGALTLRNNGEHLLRFVDTLDMLRDAVDSCNFIVRHWFGDRLHNEYVLLPVLYYFYQQANDFQDPLNDLQDVDLSRIVRWIALNEVAPSIFRGSLQQLAKLWPVLYQSMYDTKGSKYFPLHRLYEDVERAFNSDNLQLDYSSKKKAGANSDMKNLTSKRLEQRSLRLNDEDIHQLLAKTKITHRNCVPLVALLYSHPQRISLMQRYEERQIDFIQPKKLLTRKMLKTYNLKDTQAELFFSHRDSILNLQWLPKRLQTEKGDIPFRQWLNNSQQLQLLGEQNQFQKRELIINFMRFHHVQTEDGIYALHAFEHFLSERKNLLYRALKQYGQDFSDWDLQTKWTKKLQYAAF